MSSVTAPTDLPEAVLGRGSQVGRGKERRAILVIKGRRMEVFPRRKGAEHVERSPSCAGSLAGAHLEARY